MVNEPDSTNDNLAHIRKRIEEITQRAIQYRSAAYSRNTALTATHDTYLKEYAKESGEMVGELVTQLVMEGVSLALSEKQVTDKEPATKHTSNKPQPGIRKLMTPAEVAAALSISKSAAYQLLQRGDIPSVHIGKAVRVRPEDLEAFIEMYRSKLGAYY